MAPRFKVGEVKIAKSFRLPESLHLRIRSAIGRNGYVSCVHILEEAIRFSYRHRHLLRRLTAHKPPPLEGSPPRIKINTKLSNRLCDLLRAVASRLHTDDSFLLQRALEQMLRSGPEALKERNVTENVTFPSFYVSFPPKWEFGVDHQSLRKIPAGAHVLLDGKLLLSAMLKLETNGRRRVMSGESELFFARCLTGELVGMITANEIQWAYEAVRNTRLRFVEFLPSALEPCQGVAERLRMFQLSRFRILPLDAGTLTMSADTFPDLPLHQAWPLTAAANYCPGFVIATGGCEFDATIIRPDGKPVPIYKPSDLRPKASACELTEPAKIKAVENELFAEIRSPKPPIPAEPPVVIEPKPKKVPELPNHPALKMWFDSGRSLNLRSGRIDPPSVAPAAGVP